MEADTPVAERPRRTSGATLWVVGTALVWGAVWFAAFIFGFQIWLASLNAIAWLVHGILVPWSAVLLAGLARGLAVGLISWALVRWARAPRAIWLGFGIGSVLTFATALGFLVFQGGGFGAGDAVAWSFLVTPLVDSVGAYLGTRHRGLARGDTPGDEQLDRH